jgi:hypothetical protein
MSAIVVLVIEICYVVLISVKAKESELPILTVLCYSSRYPYFRDNIYRNTGSYI